MLASLKFKFKVRHRTQAAHDHRQVVLPREVDREAGVAGDLDVFQVGQYHARQLDALIDVEHRRLVGVGGDRDHDPAKNTRRAARDIFMTAGERVEGTRIHRRGSHAD